jgi:hypothetical protein
MTDPRIGNFQSAIGNGEPIGNGQSLIGQWQSSHYPLPDSLHVARLPIAHCPLPMGLPFSIADYPLPIGPRQPRL